MQKIQEQIVQPIVAAGQLEGGYHIDLAGTADKLREAWQAHALQHPAGVHHHLPADGRAVRIVALSVRDHSHRAAGRRGRRARPVAA